MIGIYKITSPTKKVYIGQSIDIIKRFSIYKNLHCKNQKALYNSFLKYGVDNHNFEVICECDINELNEKERYFQDAYCVLSKGGLNCKLTSASDRKGKHSQETKLKMKKKGKGLGRIHSEDSKKKISLSLKGKKLSKKHKEKIKLSLIGNKYSLGYSHSKETKLKMSMSNTKHFLGKKHTEEAKNKIRLASIGRDNKRKKPVKDIVTGKIFKSITEAAFFYKIDQGYLTNILNKKKISNKYNNLIFYTNEKTTTI